MELSSEISETRNEIFKVCPRLTAHNIIFQQFSTNFRLFVITFCVHWNFLGVEQLITDITQNLLPVADNNFNTETKWQNMWQKMGIANFIFRPYNYTRELHQNGNTCLWLVPSHLLRIESFNKNVSTVASTYSIFC